MLGGGFIKSAVAAADAARDSAAAAQRCARSLAGSVERRAWRATSTSRASRRAYARWAPVYDLVFGKVFDAGPQRRDRGRRAACGSSGGRILEVGVGTGISLPDYARSNRIVGIDISEPMLRKAQERVAEHRLDAMSKRWR